MRPAGDSMTISFAVKFTKVKAVGYYSYDSSIIGLRFIFKITHFPFFSTSPPIKIF